MQKLIADACSILNITIPMNNIIEMYHKGQTKYTAFGQVFELNTEYMSDKISEYYNAKYKKAVMFKIASLTENEIKNAINISIL